MITFLSAVDGFDHRVERGRPVCGRLAQLGERRVRNAEVASSSLAPSTTRLGLRPPLRFGAVLPSSRIMGVAMPIYEYVCQTCQHHFETLVSADRPPVCPRCHGRQLAKQLSVFAVSTRSSTSAPDPGACATCSDPCGSGACSLN
jgi:putative FmdB family regulatory protein